MGVATPWPPQSQPRPYTETEAVNFTGSVSSIIAVPSKHHPIISNGFTIRQGVTNGGRSILTLFLPSLSSYPYYLSPSSPLPLSLSLFPSPSSPLPSFPLALSLISLSYLSSSSPPSHDSLSCWVYPYVTSNGALVAKTNGSTIFYALSLAVNGTSFVIKFRYLPSTQAVSQ